MTLKQKLYDLKGLQKEQSDIIDKCLEADDTTSETYTKAVAEFDRLQAQVEATEAQMKRLDKLGAGKTPEDKGTFEGGEPEVKAYEDGVLKGLTHETVKNFASGVRKALNEGTPAAGGFTVPQDIVTRIYTLVGNEDNMLPYITNTPVNTDSGKRTYKTRKQKTGLLTVQEAAAIPAAEEPTFAQISYNIGKRAGYLPVTMELLEDSDEDIAALVIQWLADEARVTINKNVVTKATSGGATAISGLDGILEVLTTGLGGALRAISTIHTNDSGLLWLLKLKDKNDRPLLQADPTQPTRMVLCVGAVTVPIKVWDNETMANSGNKVPFVIGSLKEGIERFDRKSITITQLTEATVGDINLAEQDMVAFKAVMRDDYQIRDAAAFKFCQIDTGAAG